MTACLQAQKWKWQGEHQECAEDEWQGWMKTATQACEWVDEWVLEGKWGHEKSEHWMDAKGSCQESQRYHRNGQVPALPQMQLEGGDQTWIQQKEVGEEEGESLL